MKDYFETKLKAGDIIVRASFSGYSRGLFLGIVTEPEQNRVLGYWVDNKRWNERQSKWQWGFLKLSLDVLPINLRNEFKEKLSTLKLSS